MIRSMTGYSSHRQQIGEALVSLEIKALNHKVFDMHYHSSRSLSMLEVRFRKAIQQFLRRGRVEIYLRTNKHLVAEESIRANIEMAQQYMDAAKSLSDHFNISYQPKIEQFMAMNGVLDTEEVETTPEECWNLLAELIDESICNVLHMKNNEGQRLADELRSLLDKLADANERILAFRGQFMDEYREKLLDRLQEWKETVGMDDSRIIQEVAIFCDRSDVQEETVRLRSHIEQFGEILEENTDDESYKAVGRKLDFLCQEMFREVNTVGSKSSSIDIVRTVLEMKGLIEQIREQVQNVE
jgi:uncharacterized protein (TIGR00255 family)